MQKPLSRWWLVLGVTALAVAGLFALVLVVARAPQLAAMPIFANIFHQSLVVHVDLSVLAWFLSFACLMWSRQAAGSRSVVPLLEESALMCFALGMLAMTLSPLDSKGEALMSNYIPVITTPGFFFGLSLLLIAVMLMLLRLFSARDIMSPFDKPSQFGIKSAGVIAAISVAAFIWSALQLPSDLFGQSYYEIAFWGGGHVLQFVHTQLLLVCWLALMHVVCSHFHLPHKLLYGLFAVGLIAALLAPLPYLMYGIESWEHRQFFTWLMIIGNGIAPAILAIAIIPGLWKVRAERKGTLRALWSSLLMSIILFLYGGALGSLIEGQNVVIPAHYHGSIVGVTLGFMGAAYLLLPSLGYRNVSAWRLAYWQPIVYGVGQMIHISGLAWSGGYGVLRKTPGGIENVSVDVKVAMGMMGLGGLLAIIGGLMFVIVTIRAMRPVTH